MRERFLAIGDRLCVVSQRILLRFVMHENLVLGPVHDYRLNFSWRISLAADENDSERDREQ
jgi:hypothetical protein